MSSSSSLRNHRIIVASLFLPQAVVLGQPDDYLTDSPSRFVESSPGGPLDVTQVSSKLQNRSLNQKANLSRSVHASPPTSQPFTPAPSTPGAQFGLPAPLGKSVPLKSIVDDLKDRATSALPSPTSEPLNPFAFLTGSTRPSVVTAGDSTKPRIKTDVPKAKTSQGPPNASTNYMQRSHSRRMRRQSSRSKSRRPGVSSSSSIDLQASPSIDDLQEDEEEDFYFEANPHCNGGLKNALDSASRDPVPASTGPNMVRTTRTGHSRANSLQNLSKLKEKVWVGNLGGKVDKFSDSLKERIDERLREEHGSEAVWVSDEELEGCYDEFCHQVLWPALHYAVPDAPKTRTFYESASYKQYVAVNKAFAEKIAEVWKEGDIIWVNDYHLMLLPHMLRSSGLIPSNAPIGFFLHAAFPSSEIFRCLSVRSALLRGMLGADLVGFQTANHARHFRQTCSRILSVESLPRGIQLGSSFSYTTNYPYPNSNRASTPPDIQWSTSTSSALSDEQSQNPSIDHLASSAAFASVAASVGEHGKGRFVDVGVFPMGIDVNQLNERRKAPEVEEWIGILKEKYKGMKLVVGRDKMDEVQGVRQKMQAFERFLEQHASKDPELKEKVVLIQIAIPPNSKQVDEEIGNTILTTVSHINSKFSTLTYQPVVFLHTQDVSFSQYLALLRVADAFLVTSLREGMALRTHEFVVSQEGKEKEGSLVLSEFTGSYSYSGFRSCIAVNPWDIRGTAAAINQGLTMSAEESRSRWEDLHGHVISQSAQAFVLGFLTRCLRAAQEEEDEEEGDGDADHKELNVRKVVGRWKHCKPRLLLVDWEGGLVSSGLAEEQEAVEEAAAIEVLKSLVKDPRNEVWLLSGYPRKRLAKVSSEVGAKLGIVAENGCFIKARNTKGQEGEWISMVANLNMKWKGVCSEMLNYFTERTPGSYVEEREASVVWTFWKGDEVDDHRPDCQWARRQAAEAQNHIFDSLGERFSLRIIPSSESFLVIPNNISWSSAVGSILEGAAGSASEWDIVLAFTGDEKLLRRLGELDDSETVSISGKGSTDAKWSLLRTGGGESDVARVLEEFAEC